jgi:hypothetical protein
MIDLTAAEEILIFCQFHSVLLRDATISVWKVLFIFIAISSKRIFAFIDHY